MSSSLPPTVFTMRARVRQLIAALAMLGMVAALGACAAGQAAGDAASPTASAQDSGTLYAATSSLGAPPNTTRVAALAMGDGAPRWQVSLPGADAGLVTNGPTLFTGVMLANPDRSPIGGTLTALDARSGATMWQHDYAGEAPVPVAATSDTVFVNVYVLTAELTPSAISRLDALRASDGALVWSVPQFGPTGAAALGDGVLYLYTYAGASTTPILSPPPIILVALDSGTGKSLWRLTLPGIPAGASAPLLSGGMLYVPLEAQQIGASLQFTPSSVLAIKASDGTVAWQVTTPAGTTATKVLASGSTVYYVYDAIMSTAAVRGGLVALRAADGTVAWQNTTPNGGLTLLALDGGQVYTADDGSRSALGDNLTTLHTYGASNGALLSGGPVPPVKEQLVLKSDVQARVAGGTLYLFSAALPPGGTPASNERLESVVLAAGTGDGKLRWERALSGFPARTTFYVVP